MCIRDRYEGLDLSLSRRVAIKILAQSVNRNPDAVKRFQREARAVASVSHPNIAQIYRVGAFGEHHYYAMEYVDGKSLDQMIMESGRVTGRRCFELMSQAVKGLKAANEHGVTHRDIKPANLMVTCDGTVKIVDFGIAKMMDDSDTFRTVTGSIMGTPAYMSPEQCKGQPTDFHADMYSLGCTFFQMMTGRAPFDGDTAYTVMNRQISAPVPSMRSLVADVPERLCNITYTMMEKNPDNRYQTYEHLLSVLEAAREGRAAGFTAMVVEEPVAEELTPEMSRRRMIRLIVAGAAVVLVLLLAQWFAGSGGKEERTAKRDDDVPVGGLRGVAKGLRELNKADREARKDARETY